MVVTSQELQQAQQQVSQQQQQVSKTRSSLGSQTALRSQTREQQVQRQEALRQLSGQEQDLSTKQKEIASAITQVQEYEGKVAALNREQAEYEEGQRYYWEGRPFSSANSAIQKKGYMEASQSYESQKLPGKIKEIVDKINTGTMGVGEIPEWAAPYIDVPVTSGVSKIEYPSVIEFQGLQPSIIIKQPTDFISRLGRAWDKTNEQWSEKIKEAGVTPERIQGFVFGTGSEALIPQSPTRFRDYPLQQKLEEFQLGVSTTIASKPATTLVATAAFVAAPYIFSKVASIPAVNKVLATEYAKGFYTTEGMILGTATTGYAYSVKERISKPATSYEKGKVVGSILGTELIPATAGGYIAAKVVPTVGDYFRTIGRKQVPIENIVPKDVLTGKKNFVESVSYGYKGSVGKEKQLFDIKLFKKGDNTAYHVTPEEFWSDSFKVTPGTSEIAGFYVAPQASIHFAGGAGETSLFGGKFSSPYGKPAIAKITDVKFGIKPVVVSKGKFKLKFSGELQPGVAYTTGVKPEAEAVFPYGLGTEFSKVAANEYTLLPSGRVLTIDTFNVIPSGKSILSTGGLPGEAIASSYSTSASSSIFTPASSIVSLIPSSKTSSFSYTPSKPSVTYSTKSSVSFTSSPNKVTPSSFTVPSSTRYIPPSGSSIPSLPSSPSYFPPSKVPPSYAPKVPSSKIPPYSPSTYRYEGKTDKKKKIVIDTGIFEALSKRRGKEISLGTFGTQREAEFKLKNYLKGTLAASGRIKKGAEFLKFGELKTFKDIEFTPAKREATRVVQKSKFRLSSRPEVMEIKSSKRRSLKFW